VSAPANELSIEILIEAGHSHTLCEKLCNAHLSEYETGRGMESQIEQSHMNASVGVHEALLSAGGKGRVSLEGNRKLLAGIVESDAVRQWLIGINLLLLHQFRTWNVVFLVAIVVLPRQLRIFGNLIKIIIEKRKSRVIDVV